MFTHKMLYQLLVDNVATAREFLRTGGAKQSINETIADSSTDAEVAFTLDVSQCKSFFMVSDRTVTVETNDGSTPPDTIVLTAGEPYYWCDGMQSAFKLATDVTALFVTNSSGGDATLVIEALYDPTV